MTDEDGNEQFCLPSSDGFAKLCLRLLPAAVDIDSVLAAILITTTYWDRDVLLSDIAEYPRVEDAKISLPQFVMSRASLRNALRTLQNWLQRPEDLVIELGDRSRDQMLELAMKDYRGKRHLPYVYCNLLYTTTNISGRCRFPVDETCVRMFVEGLEKAIAGDRRDEETETGMVS